MYVYVKRTHGRDRAPSPPVHLILFVFLLVTVAVCPTFPELQHRPGTSIMIDKRGLPNSRVAGIILGLISEGPDHHFSFPSTSPARVRCSTLAFTVLEE